MESNRKRLGLIKGKLGKLVKSSAIQFGSSSSSRVPSTYPSEGFIVNQVMDRPSIIHHLHRHQNHQPIKQKLDPYNPNSTTFSSSSSTTTAAVDFILNQDQVTIPHKPKISFYVPPDQSTDSSSSNSSSTTTATTYYANTMLDNDSVDLKAASYISSVQERFRLERTNSERKAQCF